MRPAPVTEEMLVYVERIPDDGLDLDLPVASTWLNEALGKDSVFNADGDGRLVVHLHRVEEVVHVRGRARLTLAAPCSRCLGPTTLGIDAPVDLALFPEGTEPPATVEGEVAPDDMGVATYSEDQIDLRSIVHDEIFLELPMSPLCDDGCKGLCVTCGTNLNDTRCACEKPTDDRWSALRNIKLN
jgi:uncharacterized protein